MPQSILLQQMHVISFHSETSLKVAFCLALAVQKVSKFFLEWYFKTLFSSKWVQLFELCDITVMKTGTTTFVSWNLNSLFCSIDPQTVSPRAKSKHVTLEHLAIRYAGIKTIWLVLSLLKIILFQNKLVTNACLYFSCLLLFKLFISFSNVKKKSC